ncbi:MAG: TonB-dependent receptor [Flavobacteriaceae bacterium]|nr:TonB-dependent receptor [Flavobacteriaceae bacterium]
MKNFIFVFTLVLVQLATAQEKGIIKGQLLDGEFNNEPLAYASVSLKGTIIGTETDEEGNYRFSAPAGTYYLVLSFLGYQTLEVPITVIAGESVTVNRTLIANAVGLETIVLSAETSKQKVAAQLLIQKNATKITTSIGAEELSIKAIGNAAVAISKISGISKQEGSSNVFVRGLGDRYQNTTFNGLPLPSNDVNKKNIDLDLFSTDIIENVSVGKAYSPSFYGDFGAGNVNIDSKEYRGDGYFTINLGSGVNGNASGQDFVRNQGPSFFGFYNRYKNNPFAIVLSHGIDPQDASSPININASFEGGYSVDISDESRLSFFGTASFENEYEYLQGPALDFTNDIKVRFNNSEVFVYNTTTSAMANITYQINTDNKVSYNSLFVNSASDKVGYFGIQGLGYNRDGFSGNGDGGFYQMNAQFNQDIILVNQITGSHRFEDGKFVITWGSGYNKVLADEPDRKRISLEDYQFALDNDPNTNPIFYDNIAFDNQRFFQSIDDNEFNSYINFKKDFSENFKINFGYNGRTKERYFINHRYGYDILDKLSNPVTDVHSLDGFFDVSNINIPDGSGLWNLNIARNPQGLDQTIGLVNRPQLYENEYKGKLDIYAGYVEAEINLTDTFLVVPGIRLESISQSIEYDVINPVPTDSGRRDVDETIFLPSLNLKYSLNEDSNLRFSFSSTVSFPEFKEAANFVYEDVTQRIGGNPDLLGKPDGSGVTFSRIYNYDLKYEWFPSRSEVVSAAVFAKTINNPVNRVVATDATGNQRFFRTGNKAEILGLEIEFRKNLLMKDEDKALLTFGGNFAFTGTKQDLKPVLTSDGFTFGTSFGSRTSDELQGASPVIVNADLTYNPEFGKFKPQAAITFSYFSDRIYALGSGDLGNMVEKGLPYLNLILKNNFGEDIELGLKISNILNPNVSLIRENTGAQGSPLLAGTGLVNANGDVTLLEFKRGVNIGVSLKYKF